MLNISSFLGGSPGIVVMGGDPRSKGRVFESLHCILDGHTHISYKNCNDVCLKRPKINDIKEAGAGPFQKDNSPYHNEPLSIFCRFF